jgi:hypothetical protein
MAPQWVWDASRRQYYYLTQTEYVYQNGLRIPIYPNATTQSNVHGSTAPTIPQQADDPKTAPYVPDESALEALTEEADKLSISPTTSML